ncbi:MAG: polymer-forming cytoskeletal protein [Verrucomicrobiales bacterium]
MLKQIINQDEEAAAGESADRGEGNGSNAGSTRSASKSGNVHSMTAGNSMTAGKNILSSDVEIKGKLRFSNDLVIDGRIEGEVNSEGDLTVGENAEIVGDIRTRSVVVFGKVDGNITVTDRCELKQNAELNGDVVASKLAIEEGATFMGLSTVGTSAKNSGDGDQPENGDGGN